MNVGIYFDLRNPPDVAPRPDAGSTGSRSRCARRPSPRLPLDLAQRAPPLRRRLPAPTAHLRRGGRGAHEARPHRHRDRDRAAAPPRRARRAGGGRRPDQWRSPRPRPRAPATACPSSSCSAPTSASATPPPTTARASCGGCGTGRHARARCRRGCPIWMGYQGPKGARRAGLLGEGLLSVDPPPVASPTATGWSRRGHDPATAGRMAGGINGLGHRRPRGRLAAGVEAHRRPVRLVPPPHGRRHRPSAAPCPSTPIGCGPGRTSRGPSRRHRLRHARRRRRPTSGRRPRARRSRRCSCGRRSPACPRTWSPAHVHTICTRARAPPRRPRTRDPPHDDRRRRPVSPSTSCSTCTAI